MYAWEPAWEVWDGRSFGEAVAQARARAIARAWTNDAFSGSQGSRGHDLLAIWITDHVDIPPIQATSTTYTADARDIHARWALAFARVWQKLQGDSGFSQEEINSAAADATQGKTKATTTQGISFADAGAVPVVVLVVAIVAMAALGAFLFYRGTDFVLQTVAKYAADRELVRLHEEAKSIYIEHAAREQAAGHALPWNEYEMSILRQLETGSKTQIESGRGSSGEGAGTGTAAAFGLGAIIALAGAVALVYFYSRKR